MIKSGKASVGLFAKYPEPGQVKTRLIPLLGEQRASNFASYLLLSMLSRFLTDTCLASLSVWLWRSGGTDSQWRRLLQTGIDLPVEQLQLRWQTSEHLGARMQSALAEQLKTSPKAMLVGTDAIQMSPAICRDLLLGLDTHRVGFVPALDGGYVAVGCTQPVPSLFDESICWGTGSVLQQSLKAAQHDGVSFFCLDSQLDIDEPEDYQKAIETGLIPSSWHNQFK